VYHTSDTYIAGTLMNAFLRERAGSQKDFFTDLLVTDILQPLGFSQTMRTTLRSYDDVAQPFTGYGLTVLPDDIARYALFLLDGEGQVNGRQVLNRAQLAAALQKHPGDPGLPAATDSLRYNNGVWAARLLLPAPCDSSLWIPFMSGYGGISVALLPNGSVYYVFSDGAHFKWSDAAIESHRIKPFCENNSEYIQ
jgi:CubicO group peptidase (beta-lactamase class C family)